MISQNITSKNWNPLLCRTGNQVDLSVCFWNEKCKLFARNSFINYLFIHSYFHVCDCLIFSLPFNWKDNTESPKETNFKHLLSRRIRIPSQWCNQVVRPLLLLITVIQFDWKFVIIQRHTHTHDITTKYANRLWRWSPRCPAIPEMSHIPLSITIRSWLKHITRYITLVSTILVYKFFLFHVFSSSDLSFAITLHTIGYIVNLLSISNNTFSLKHYLFIFSFSLWLFVVRLICLYIQTENT